MLACPVFHHDSWVELGESTVRRADVSKWATSLPRAAEVAQRWRCTLVSVPRKHVLCLWSQGEESPPPPRLVLLRAHATLTRSYLETPDVKI